MRARAGSAPSAFADESMRDRSTSDAPSNDSSKLRTRPMTRVSTSAQGAICAEPYSAAYPSGSFATPDASCSRYAFTPAVKRPSVLTSVWSAGSVDACSCASAAADVDSR